MNDAPPLSVPQPRIDEALLGECPPLPLPRPGEAWLSTADAWRAQYDACRVGKSDESKAVRSLAK